MVSILQCMSSRGEKNDDGSDSWPVYAKPEIETPATDRIYAGIKADGVEEFAAHLLSMECHLEATWAKSFVSEVLNVKGR